MYQIKVIAACAATAKVGIIKLPIVFLCFFNLNIQMIGTKEKIRKTSLLPVIYIHFTMLFSQLQTEIENAIIQKKGGGKNANG